MAALEVKTEARATRFAGEICINTICLEGDSWTIVSATNGAKLLPSLFVHLIQAILSEKRFLAFILLLLHSLRS